MKIALPTVHSKINDIPNVKFAHERLSNYYVGSDQIYSYGDMFFSLSKDGIIAFFSMGATPELVRSAEDRGIVAVVNDKRIIINGDILVWDNIFSKFGKNYDSTTFITDKDMSHCPTASFNCFGRFLTKKGTLQPVLKSAKMLAKAEIIDCTHAHQVNATKEEMKKVKKGDTIVSKIGYTLINGTWHQSSSVLLSILGQTILLGQDEGSYFGCQLPKKARTITEAYEILKPHEIGNKPFVRQGEWFMVEESLPKNIKVHEHFHAYGDGSITLPKETADSNDHYLFDCDIVFVNGKVYCRHGELHHDQHQAVFIPRDKWHTFYRNTAMRSYSEEGVD